MSYLLLTRFLIWPLRGRYQALGNWQQQQFSLLKFHNKEIVIIKSVSKSFKFTHCVYLKTTLTFMYVPCAFLELKLNIVHYTGNGLSHPSWYFRMTVNNILTAYLSISLLKAYQATQQQWSFVTHLEPKTIKVCPLSKI